jgi:hypothetical protein
MVTTIKPKDYILSSLIIKAEDVGASEWLAIVQKSKSICNPYLKYLPGFTPIREAMNDWQKKRSTDNKVAEFFEGFDGESLCVWVSGLSSEGEGTLSPGAGVRFWMEKELLLTRKGQLVLWDAKYEREIRWGRGNDYDVIEKAIYSRFSEVSDDDILTLFTHHPRLGRDIVSKLWQLATKGVEERQRRLRDFNEMEKALAGFWERTS